MKFIAHLKGIYLLRKNLISFIFFRFILMLKIQTNKSGSKTSLLISSLLLVNFSWNSNFQRANPRWLQTFPWCFQALGKIPRCSFTVMQEIKEISRRRGRRDFHSSKALRSTNFLESRVYPPSSKTEGSL